MEFLIELATSLYQKYGSGVSDLRIVFPNRRAGLFFTSELGKLIDKPVWAPKVQSLTDFVSEISGLSCPDEIDLIFELGLCYNEIDAEGQNPQNLARFWFWAALMLKDFDDIDFALADTTRLFHEMLLQREMDLDWSDFLSEEQLAAIRSFNSNFIKKEPDKIKERFIQLWKQLPLLYDLLNKNLKAKGQGYTDKTDAGWRPEENKVIFAGFNGLNACELSIINTLAEAGCAEIIWNADAWYLDNNKLEAGYFLRRYLKPDYLKRYRHIAGSFPKVFPQRKSAPGKRVEITGVSLDVGQARASGQLIGQLVDSGVPLSSIGLVLPKQDLLFAVLHGLPQSVTDVNVTMGYPLRATPLYSLLVYLIDLQLSAKTYAGGSKVLFHHSHVLGLLRHPYILYHNIGEVIQNIADIEKSNRIYIGLDHLINNNKLFALIFQRVDDVNGIFKYITDILYEIYRYVQKEQTRAELNNRVTFEEEYISAAYEKLKALHQVTADLSLTLHVSEFWEIYKQVIETATLPFTGGSQGGGLQIMGLLEARNLDFEYLIVLSANEGTLPPEAPQGSLVPFNLRKGFGMPVYTEHDALYSHSFYNLVLRAKQVHLFYNAVNEGQAKGEPSRFIYRLKYETDFQITESTLVNQVHALPVKTISVAKAPAVMQALNSWLVSESDPGKSLSPSAVNTYINCSLQFFFMQVLGLRSVEEVSEEMDSSDFGNVLHKAMERLYTGLINEKKSITAEPSDFERLIAQAEEAVNQSFDQKFSFEKDDVYELAGRNLIVRDVITKYVSKLLEQDKAYAPFEVLILESGKKYNYEMNLQTPSGLQKIRLGGQIDRIDRKEGTVRIIDYKTGSDDTVFPDIANLFDRDAKKQLKGIMQVLFYAMLFKHNSPAHNGPITAGLLKMRDLFNSDFSYDAYDKIIRKEGKMKTPVTDVTDLLPEFERHLRLTLEELYNPEIPFVQTPYVEKCAYCGYTSICHR